MIAFEFFVNGKRLGTAGVGDLGVLSAIVTWVRRAPENSRDGKSFEEELTFSVGGLHEDTDADWLYKKLSVGDVVTINIVTAETVDQPKRVRRLDPDIAEKSERRYFEQLKKKYAADEHRPAEDAKTSRARGTPAGKTKARKRSRKSR